MSSEQGIDTAWPTYLSFHLAAVQPPNSLGVYSKNKSHERGNKSARALALGLLEEYKYQLALQGWEKVNLFLLPSPKSRKPPVEWPVGCVVSLSLSCEALLRSIHTRGRRQRDRTSGRAASRRSGHACLLFWMDTPF